MNLRVVFMGSPAFSLPVLHRVASAYNVVGVVTQPDRPSGRGRQLTAPPVKTLALTLGLEVFQPPRLREAESMAVLTAWNPELIIVAAYGQILRKDVLQLPLHGCINVHASLLPRWRGAAPIQAAILSGDAETGVTIMQMDAGVDTGAVLAWKKTDILPTDTGESLTERLASLGADCLIETLPGVLSGEIAAQLQPAEGATYAPVIQKEHGRLDFNQSVDVLERQVRAYHSAPGAYLDLDGTPVKVHRAHILADSGAQPAVRTQIEDQPAVGASGGWLILDEVQSPGKNPMPGKAFLRGARNWLDQKSTRN